MKELYEQIQRFQALAETTYVNKSSSYTVSINFNFDWDDTEGNIVIYFGTYDILGMPTQSEIKTTKNNLIKDVTEFVDKCYKNVKKEFPKIQS